MRSKRCTCCAREYVEAKKRVVRTDRSFSEEVPKLLGERAMSQRALARVVGINQSHLSRLSGPGARQVPSLSLAAAVAEALDLPPDYFIEYRRARVIQAMDSDGSVRDRLYALVTGT
jgi:transcriptional regulator with XRE-family HTH domain